MHSLYFVVTEPKGKFDWKKVSQKVQDILENNNFVNSNRGYWGRSKADWFEIGGRWSGELSRLKMGNKNYYDETLKALNFHSQHLTDTDIETHKEFLQSKWVEMGGLGINPYQRTSFNPDGEEDDSMIITPKLLKQIKKRYADKGEFEPVECFIEDDYDEINVAGLTKKHIGKIITVIDYHN